MNTITKLIIAAVLLPTANCLLPTVSFAQCLGSGADGAITISTGKNINTDIIAAGRTEADAVNFSVTSGTISSGATSITLSSAPTGLAVNDEILIINLQGSPTDFNNVGNYETKTVTAIASNTLTLNSSLCKNYGDASTQKIMIQRVPNYTNVTISSGVSLTANAWNGAKGGVFCFKATGTVTINGSINMSGKGYLGGTNGASQGYYCSWNPTQQLGCSGNGGDACGGNGEGIYTGKGGKGGGPTIIGECCNGGANSGGGGGGAGYANNGNAGASTSEGCSVGGAGGAIYGSTNLNQILPGSGGGGGAGTSGYMGMGYSGTGSTGGAGGGIILLYASTINITGPIQNNGNNGTPGIQGVYDPGSRGGGGGAGAGGSICLNVPNMDIGGNLVTALGGNGGTVAVPTAGIGGASSVGRIRLNYTTLSGTTNPASYDSALAACGSCAALPVELLTFSATAENNTLVRCEWATASESNNDYFGIERSKDGTTFAQIAIMPSKAPGGNSSVTLHYGYDDSEPYTGLSYYRLRQVDFNGVYEYSPVRAVYIGTLDIISIFLNPSSEYIHYTVSSEDGGTVTVKLYDALGREVYNKEETIGKGVTEKKVGTQNFASGNYLIRITNGNKEKTQKQFVIR